MSDIDYDRLSSEIARKIKESNREKRDEEFIKKLAEELKKTQSPCHSLTEEQVVSLKDLLNERKKLGKGLAWLALAVLAMWVKDIYHFISSFIHIGSQ